MTKRINASNILPGLFMGSVPPVGQELAQQGYRRLVLCAMEFQYPEEMFQGVKVLHCPLDDQPTGLTPDEWNAACLASDRVASAVSRGRPTLVTCAMGINRSGVVTALSVAKLLGCNGRKAVQIVKEGRPQALQNKAFVAQLVDRVRAPGHGR